MCPGGIYPHLTFIRAITQLLSESALPLVPHEALLPACELHAAISCDVHMSQVPLHHPPETLYVLSSIETDFNRTCFCCVALPGPLNAAVTGAGDMKRLHSQTPHLLPAH